jgi:hypothetical protein
MKNSDNTYPRLPWWRVPMVWLVIAGPAVVVLAGIATTVIAVRGADPDVRVSARAQPAVQARNHAATPQAQVPR